MTTNLHIVLPGLLDPVDEELPPTPVLDLLLARARIAQTPSSGLAATVFSLFDWDFPGQGDLPSAALSRLGEGGDPDPDNAWWLHADPVAIQPLRDRLVLLGNEGLKVTKEEAGSLVESVNQAFAADGWYMEAAAPDRWYLRVPEASGLSTRRLREVIGHDLKTCLPGGREGAVWRRALNEIQMLFHGSEVNRLREERGQQPINSVWLFGAGRLPDPIKSSFRTVVSDHPLARGLARWTDRENVNLRPLSAELIQDGGGNLLWVGDDLQRERFLRDVGARRQGIERAESLLSELPSLLRTGRITQACIHTCDGRCFRVDRAGMRRLWKRPRCLSHFITSSSSRIRE